MFVLLLFLKTVTDEQYRQWNQLLFTVTDGQCCQCNKPVTLDCHCRLVEPYLSLLTPGLLQHAVAAVANSDNDDADDDDEGPGMMTLFLMMH